MKFEKKMSAQQAVKLFREVFIDFIAGVEDSLLIDKMGDIETVKFVNYNSWTWIEPLIMLKSRLSLIDDKSKYKNRVTEVLNTGDELQVNVNNARFKRLLNGEIIGLDLLEQAKIDGDNEEQLDVALKIIAQLLTVAEMGGGENFSVAQANEQLNQYKSEANVLLIEHPEIK